MIVSVKDGKTPYIGENGNWWIGETDTGVKAEYTETDPTVPAWAKEPTKPTYTASEVGAVKSGGDQVSGDYTLQGNLTLGELYADILNLGSDEDGVYAGVYRDHNGVLNLEIFGRENDDPVRLNGIETPIGDYSAANKLYVDSTKLIVTASYSEAGGFYERSHTNEEIVTAVQEGRNVRLDVYFEDEELWYTYHLSDFMNSGTCCFTRTDGWNILSYINVYSDDTIWDIEINTLTAGNIGAAPRHIYSTADLTAGVSALTTGQLYIVYE